MFADILKKSILQDAIQGKLTKQLPSDGDAKDLLKQIHAEKSKLIANGKLKPEKNLPPIQPDEIPFDIPKNWQWVRLGDILKFVQYGTAKKSQKKVFIPVLRMGNLQDGKIDWKNLVYTSDEGDIKNYKLSPNDILFNRTNSVELVGKVAIYKSERTAIFAGYLIRLQPIFTNNDFLNFLMQSTYYKNFCYSVLTRGVSQANINAEKLKKFLVPLPPLAEQNRIVARLEKILPEVEALANAESELDHLQKNFPRQFKNAILQDAIQGKLTKQLPTDGDANDLLKQIQAEKNKLIADGKIKSEKNLPPIQPDELPFDIPQNWQWVRLGDIGIFISGYTPKNNELDLVGEIPYFKVADMNTTGNEIFLHNTNLYLKNRPAKIYSKNTIVYPKNGGAVFTNKKRILQQDSVVDLNTGGYKIFSSINLMYIYSYFLLVDFKFFYKGTALPTLDIKKLKELLIPLPPLAEQKRLVARLDEILPVIALLANLQ